MAECDMCGKEAELVKAIVEGSTLSVCKNCSKFGKIVSLPYQEQKRSFSSDIPVKQSEIISGAGSIIKKAREEKGITQKQLAKAIAEKESIIHSIESGHCKPSLKTAKKLEQFFEIRLIESIDEEHNEGKQINSKAEGMTIGDLLKIKK